MTERIILSNKQIEVLIQYIEKSAIVLSKVEEKYPEVYYECMKDSPDFPVKPNEFGNFIKVLKEQIGE